ncbi:MAG: S46 family peptidase, partial [Bacteroidota bacterium]|nr:S46 family peptidase [Bacteroidota bacterium]
MESHLIRSLRYSFVLFLLVPATLLQAYEGMWLPTLLKSIEGDMQTAGLQITAEDIYSINNGSIKDAVVLFGGGCTAEVISAQGLILTNHHCGFSQIAEHSTLEKDYLKNGFWAADHSTELRNPGLTATFIIRMEDVSDQILAGLDPAMTESQRREAITGLSGPIVKMATEGTHYKATIRPFNYGNSYYLIITETFTDVRLVGAPPSAIGKFGGDTDNWVWPRHNADFSMFRIYANAENLPAEPADTNVPFKPRHVLPISMDGVKEGDFAMIFGFPGNTQRYLTSYAVEYVVEKSDPMRIKMREASLAVIDDAMSRSDLTRLQYADKQSSISNAYKKWIGELRGLKDLNTIGAKRELEKEYMAKAVSADPKFAKALTDLQRLYGEYGPYAMARDLFIEMVYYGPEILRFADRAHILIENYDSLVTHQKAAGTL